MHGGVCNTCVTCVFQEQVASEGKKREGLEGQISDLESAVKKKEDQVDQVCGRRHRALSMGGT